MRREIYALLLILLGLSSYKAKAQDIHFSQYNSAPMLLNPALTGVMGSDYRLAVNYKSQWAGVGKFNTIAGSYDMNVLRKTAKSNFGGIGVSFFNDRGGDLSFSTTQVNLNLSYTVVLNRRGSQFITAGLTGGFGQRMVDYSKVTTDAQFGDQGYDANKPTGENFGPNKKLFADVGAGILWSLTQKNNSNYYAGVTVSHLNQPNLSLLSNRDEKLFIKMTFHGGGSFMFGKQLGIMPSFMVLNQGPHWEYNVGALVKFKKSNLPTDHTAFYVGASYRVLDAIIFQARVDIVGLNIGFSYDMNLSKLTTATKLNGGPEVSLIYNGIFPNKKSNQAICPATL